MNATYITHYFHTALQYCAVRNLDCLIVFLDKFADYTFLCVQIPYHRGFGFSFCVMDMGFTPLNISKLQLCHAHKKKNYKKENDAVAFMNIDC